MASMKEYVRPIWVSYSGQDKEIVHSLVNHVHSQENLDANARLFKLHTYLKEPDDNYTIKDSRDSDDESCISFLKPGQKISDLVSIIGNSYRKIIFLSPSYLQSQYCMQELVHCLIINNKAPLFICKIGFDNGWGSVRERREYSWSEGVCVDLYTALTQIYERFVKNSKFAKSSSKKVWCEADFKGALEKLYSRCSASSINFGEDLSNKNKDNFYRDVIRYLEVENLNHNIKDYLDGRDLKLRRWFESEELGRYMVNTLNFNSKVFISSLREGRSEELHNLNDFLGRKGKEISEALDSNINQIDDFIGMLLESVLHPEFVCELTYSQIRDDPIYLFFSEMEGEDNRRNKLLNAQVAYSAVRRNKLRFSLVGKAPVIKNTIDFITRSPDEMLLSGDDIAKEVISKVYNICSDAAERIIDEIKSEDYSRYYLVAEIDAYQRKEPLIIQGCQDSLRDGGEDFTKYVYDALNFINGSLTKEDSASLDFIVFTFDPGKKVVFKDEKFNATACIMARGILEWANTMK